MTTKPLTWRDIGPARFGRCDVMELARTNDTTRRFVRVRDGRIEVAKT